jgi:hypothetical protein
MAMITSWTGTDLRLFQQAAGLTNERLAERLNVAVRTVAYWRKQAYGELPDMAQRVLTQAFESAPEPVRQRFEAVRSRTDSPADTPDIVIASAADEADADPVSAAAEYDPESIDWVWEQSLEVARAGNRPAFDTFMAARRVRRHALEMAERTKRPVTLSDLYVISGQATALMASTAFDLNRWDAAESLGRSAVRYASLAGHASLESWTLGLMALLANWRNEPDTALRLINRGLNVAPTGSPRVRLHHIASRSYALLGDAASVQAVLDEGRRDLDDADRTVDLLSQQTGGEFAFGRARASACAATAWLDLRHGKAAEESAQLALADLTALPPGRRPFSQTNGVRIDLASARLLRHDVDGAEECLDEVLALPAALRNMSLSGRLVRVDQTLESQQWNNNAQARHFAERIRTWLEEEHVISAAQAEG